MDKGIIAVGLGLLGFAGASAHADTGALADRGARLLADTGPIQGGDTVGDDQSLYLGPSAEPHLGVDADAPLSPAPTGGPRAFPGEPADDTDVKNPPDLTAPAPGALPSRGTEMPSGGTLDTGGSMGPGTGTTSSPSSGTGSSPGAAGH
jgi:hypothetical protein